MGHVAVPYTRKKIPASSRMLLRCAINPQIRTHRWRTRGQKKEDRPSSSHLSNHSGIIQTKKNLAMTCRSREKVHYHSEWKTHQDVVHWIILARAQEKGLQFWQTRSHAIIVYSSVPADSIYKVISQKGERTLTERLSTPRPAPNMVLKSAWQSQTLTQFVLLGFRCGDSSGSTRNYLKANWVEP